MRGLSEARRPESPSSPPSRFLRVDESSAGRVPLYRARDLSIRDLEGHEFQRRPGHVSKVTVDRPRDMDTVSTYSEPMMVRNNMTHNKLSVHRTMEHREMSSGTAPREANGRRHPMDPQIRHHPTDPQTRHHPTDHQTRHHPTDPQTRHHPTDPQTRHHPTDPQTQRKRRVLPQVNGGPPSPGGVRQGGISSSVRTAEVTSVEPELQEADKTGNRYNISLKLNAAGTRPDSKVSHHYDESRYNNEDYKERYATTRSNHSPAYQSVDGRHELNNNSKRMLNGTSESRYDNEADERVYQWDTLPSQHTTYNYRDDTARSKGRHQYSDRQTEDYQYNSLSHGSQHSPGGGPHSPGGAPGSLRQMTLVHLPDGEQGPVSPQDLPYTAKATFKVQAEASALGLQQSQQRFTRDDQYMIKSVNTSERNNTRKRSKSESGGHDTVDLRVYGSDMPVNGEGPISPSRAPRIQNPAPRPRQQQRQPQQQPQRSPSHRSTAHVSAPNRGAEPRFAMALNQTMTMDYLPPEGEEDPLEEEALQPSRTGPVHAPPPSSRRHQRPMEGAPYPSDDDADMPQVVRGSILIKNSIDTTGAPKVIDIVEGDESDDDFVVEDNTNPFHGRYFQARENPMYSSDPDLSKIDERDYARRRNPAFTEVFQDKKKKPSRRPVNPDDDFEEEIPVSRGQPNFSAPAPKSRRRPKKQSPDGRQRQPVDEEELAPLRRGPVQSAPRGFGSDPSDSDDDSGTEVEPDEIIPMKKTPVEETPPPSDWLSPNFENARPKPVSRQMREDVMDGPMSTDSGTDDTDVAPDEISPMRNAPVNEAPSGPRDGRSPRKPTSSKTTRTVVTEDMVQGKSAPRQHATSQRPPVSDTDDSEIPIPVTKASRASDRKPPTQNGTYEQGFDETWDETRTNRVYGSAPRSSRDTTGSRRDTSRTTTTKTTSERNQSHITRLLKDAPPDSIKQTINVEREEEEIMGPLPPGQAEGPDGLLNFDTVSEKVDMGMEDGKAIVSVKVRCERVVPIRGVDDLFKKSSVIVTRLIEIDLLVTEERKKLYENIMNKSNSRQQNSEGSRLNSNMKLSTKDTFNLYKTFMGLAEADEEGKKQTSLNIERQVEDEHRPDLAAAKKRVEAGIGLLEEDVDFGRSPREERDYDTDELDRRVEDRRANNRHAQQDDDASSYLSIASDTKDLLY